MAVKRKIDAMHERFGILPDKMCEDCDNLIQGDYHGIHLRKCTVYGATHSAATDWRKKYVACGMFNQEYHGRTIIDVLKHTSMTINDPIDGQIYMEV